MAKQTVTVSVPPVPTDSNPGQQSAPVPSEAAPVTPAVLRARYGAAAAHGNSGGSNSGGNK